MAALMAEGPNAAGGGRAARGEGCVASGEHGGAREEAGRRGVAGYGSGRHDKGKKRMDGKAR
ncbi:hypothetical protein PtB15_7B470 [Puccinia triticina]|nr:hypothetical protein PtB15_7B470 [Puccinia triticina]